MCDVRVAVPLHVMSVGDARYKHNGRRTLFSLVFVPFFVIFTLTLSNKTHVIVKKSKKKKKKRKNNTEVCLFIFLFLFFFFIFGFI